MPLAVKCLSSEAPCPPLEESSLPKSVAPAKPPAAISAAAPSVPARIQPAAREGSRGASGSPGRASISSTGLEAPVPFPGGSATTVSAAMASSAASTPSTDWVLASVTSGSAPSGSGGSGGSASAAAAASTASAVSQVSCSRSALSMWPRSSPRCPPRSSASRSIAAARRRAASWASPPSTSPREASGTRLRSERWSTSRSRASRRWSASASCSWSIIEGNSRVQQVPGALPAARLSLLADRVGAPRQSRREGLPVLLLQSDEESSDHAGIELRAGAAAQLCTRLIHAQSRAVDTVRCHGLVRIRRGKDSRLEGNLLAYEPRRVAAAVLAFVVGEDPAADVLEVATAEDVGADLGMAAHLHPLLFGQRSGLAKDGVGKAHLADVVQLAGDLDTPDVPGPEPELCRDHARVAANGPRVVGCSGVAEVDRLRQREQRVEVDLPVAGVAAGLGELGAEDDGAVPP